MVMSLLETGCHPLTVFTMPLWKRNPMPCLCLSSFPLKKTLCSSYVVLSPKFFHFISQRSGMFHLYLSISCVSQWSFPAVVSVHGYVVSAIYLWWCTSSVLDNSALVYGGRYGPCWPRWRPILYGVVTCFHQTVSHGKGTAWWSPSLSRLSTWPLSSSLNPSAHPALVFKLWGYPPSDAVLTPAISPITGRIVEPEGGGILFLPVQVQRTYPLPWLLEFTTFNDLVLMNIFGHHKVSRRWTWHGLNGQHHNEIDNILVRKRFRSGVNNAKPVHEIFQEQTFEVIMPCWW